MRPFENLLSDLALSECRKECGETIITIFMKELIKSSTAKTINSIFDKMENEFNTIRNSSTIELGVGEEALNISLKIFNEEFTKFKNLVLKLYSTDESIPQISSKDT